MANFFQRYRPLLAVGLVAANTAVAAADQPKPADIKVSQQICTILGSDIHRMDLLLDPDEPKEKRPPRLWLLQTAEVHTIIPAIGSAIDSNPVIQNQLKTLEAKPSPTDSIKIQAEAERKSHTIRQTVENAVWAACPHQSEQYKNWREKAKQYAAQPN